MPTNTGAVHSGRRLDMYKALIGQKMMVHSLGSVGFPITDLLARFLGGLTAVVFYSLGLF